VHTFVAFLRGINVGGNKKVPMMDLKKALEKAGYENVKTLLNSGNVVLDAPEKNPETVRKNLEALLEKTFTFPVPVLVRTFEELVSLEDSDPFKGVKITNDTLLYVTFLSGPAKGALKVPYTSPDTALRVLSASKTEVFWVLTKHPGVKSTDAMLVIEKEYGKGVTTRNWNTVEKLLGSSKREVVVKGTRS
jgi:uncharacterized protein (DUF1697 family)